MALTSFVEPVLPLGRAAPGPCSRPREVRRREHDDFCARPVLDLDPFSCARHIPLLVQRWTRFGHDRLSVRGSDGERTGWTDLRTGAAHPTSTDHLPALCKAVEDWKTRAQWGPDAAPPAPAQPADDRAARERLPVAPPRPWRDLATNAPGAAVRVQATALRDAAPVRTFFARLIKRRTNERAWRLGADGEVLVARELARVVRTDPRWRVLHAVPVGTGDSDIDHLVIGPGGVFTVNTKHHPGGTSWSVPRRSWSTDSAARTSATAATRPPAPAVSWQQVVDARPESTESSSRWGEDRLVVKSRPAGVDVVPRSRSRPGCSIALTSSTTRSCGRSRKRLAGRPPGARQVLDQDVESCVGTGTGSPGSTSARSP